MSMDDANSTFDFDNDPEFNENFYKNIEKILGDSNGEATKDDSKEGRAAVQEVTEGKIKNTKGNVGNTKENDPNTKGNNATIKENDGKAIGIEGNTKAYVVGAAGEESVALELQSAEEVTEEEINDRLTDINASLAKQICEEMETIGTENIQHQKKCRWSKIRKGILLTLLCLVSVGIFLGFTKPGNALLIKMGVDLSSKIWVAWTGNFGNNTDLTPDIDYLDEEDIKSQSPELDPSLIVWADHPGDGRQEEGVYNILLMGEESIGSGSARGRTDLIIIATLNTKNKAIKLTSLMRDMLVQIPGYQDNKLNTAYEKGGINLMYETIALNFDIRLDGCALVNFENFEKIIDRLGGLKITLTTGEAKYLNTTNYISKPQYRKVVAGEQTLNGNQVLGYSRVRKRATITGNNNDYGRTDRHRIVLNAIFDKYKTKSKVDLAAIMIGVLPMITTDIDSKCFELLLNTFIEMGTTDMTQLRIPAEGTFTDNVKVRGMDVLIPDLQENVEVLHNFIFGDTSVSFTDSNVNIENKNVTGTTNNSTN